MIFHPVNSASFVVLMLICRTDAIANLTSSTDSVCPGDRVVFTCVTDTRNLAWRSNGSKHLYYNPSGQLFSTGDVNIFTVNLTSVTGMVLVSTATVHNVQLSHNGAVITCSDGADIQQNDHSVNGTVQIASPPSSTVQNLSFCFFHGHCTLSPVIISWVAPLDTPLCVHSYTVTVRNNCNSSQVMVYNTTDNRSSMNITDLISDCDYSVTVAGRDGAGRLGQESEELNISIISQEIIALGYDFVLMNGICGIHLYWNFTNRRMYDSFVITHNVSSDQSPITVNRTNVTLYGVQPGETYTVEITTYPSGCICTVSIEADPEELSVSTNGCHSCSTVESSEVVFSSTHSSMPVGSVATIASSVILAVILLCYLIICMLHLVTKSFDNDNDTGNSQDLPQSSTELEEYGQVFSDNNKAKGTSKD